MDKKYGLEEIRAEAVESILEFGGKRLSVHLPYADEPTDPVTLRGYPVVMDSTPTEMTECLGYACPAKSDTCTICPLATATEKKEDTVFSVVFIRRPMPSFDSVFQSRHDAMYALYERAPTSRGGRASAEAVFFKRMRF